MDKILSIIIPTYNMEHYLNKCLDSLLITSNLEKLEVLVINDGSKDNSLNIALSYQEKYPVAFKVIDKENNNYGSCINRGLKEATGKYVKVLDADDSFDNGILNDIIKELETISVDLVFTDYLIVDEWGRETKLMSFDFKQNTILSAIEEFNKKSIKVISMHSIIYNREIFKHHNYTQTEGISYTDQEWIFSPMTEVQNFIYLKKSLYKYLVGREGQTISNMGKGMPQLIRVVKNMCQFYEKYCRNEPSAYKTYLINQLEAQLRLIYREGLLKQTYPFEILLDFEYYLKENCPNTYQITEEIKECKIHFINSWRFYKASLPLIRILWYLNNKSKNLF